MKQITHIKCIWPFTILGVHHHGYCYSCCPTWTKIGNVGKLTDVDSLMEIWNNERMQYIRQAVLDDQLGKVCDFKNCPFAIKNENLELETMKNGDRNFNHIIDQIMAGQTRLDNPPYTFEVANSGRCNLKCVMCQSNDKFIEDDQLLEQKLFTKIIPEILPRISRLYLSGNGEVFFNQQTVRFLRSLNPALYPDLKIQILSNGTLLTPKLWKSIRHNHFDSISISVDAACRETYQSIRKNGNWDNVIRNLEFIGELRRQKIFSHYRITFVVMKSNYHEMKAFVELGLQLGCDEILFQKIFGYADIRENINFTRNTKLFAEIAKILADPIFTRPEVNTTLIDDYRVYIDKKISFRDKLCTTGKEWLCYWPMRTIYSLPKSIHWISDLYEFAKQKRIG